MAVNFTSRPVTRFGRPMVLLSLRDGRPVGYFKANELAQAKVNYMRQADALSA